jgi:PAS domain S-box-containing protein
MVRAVLDEVSDAVVVVDPTGGILYRNRTALEELAIPAAGYSFYSWMRDAEVRGARAGDGGMEQFRRVMEGGPAVEVLLVATSVHGTVELEVKLVALRDGPQVPAVVITLHRRVASGATMDSQWLLDSIVENIPDMIFVKDAEHLRFVRLNRAGEELLGWSRDVILGKTDQDFFPVDEAAFFQQKDREVLSGGALLDIPEESIATNFKGQRILHTKKIPILDEHGKPRYLLGISEDVTERKKSEQIAREYADLVRHALVAMMAWRLDGTIVSWNPAAERIFGISTMAAMGRSIRSLVPDSELAQFEALQTELLQGKTPTVVATSRIRGDGQEILVEASHFVIMGDDGNPARIASVIRDITEVARLRRAAQLLIRQDKVVDQGSGQSKAMRLTLEAADLIAQDPMVSVLLLGETGVGKGWLARHIHLRSSRAGKPFLEINCAGLSAQLAEAELFGYERGAFTGATAQKQGLVEAGAGGTLFLDEIGELPMEVQAQLLTFLDTRRYRRVGGARMLSAEVRIMAATNADLKVAVARGTFRHDLYFRLSVMPIVVPPLRERVDDISPLAEEILMDLWRRSGRESARIPVEVMAALRRYSWPGNVRELRNALERALILSRGSAIRLEHLPAEIRDPEPLAPPGSDRLDQIERRQIEQVLKEHGGNRSKAADALGISRSTLKRKLGKMP